MSTIRVERFFYPEGNPPISEFNIYGRAFILRDLLVHKLNSTFPTKMDSYPFEISTTYDLNYAIRCKVTAIKGLHLDAYTSSDAFNDALAQLEVFVEKWGDGRWLEKEDKPLFEQRLEEYENVARELSIQNRAVLAAAEPTD